mgnify:CR=1 FL=1
MTREESIKLFGPRRTFVEVAREPAEGLENGTITLDEEKARTNYREDSRYLKAPSEIDEETIYFVD